MKKAVSLLLAFVLMLSLAVPAFAAGGFTDVADNAWYANAVSYVQSHGLMSGTGNNRFSPNTNTTRAMLVTILYRYAGSPTVSGSANFTDVRQDYYTTAVNWAAQNNVVSGYGDGRFGVNDSITRQDVAAVLWRYEGSPAASAQDFADESSIASYAAPAVDWARANGIISGKGNNRFDPRGNATRAEIATMVMNYAQYKEGDEPTPPTPPTPSGSNTLVVYYSATGSTESVANYIADELGADIFELMANYNTAKAAIEDSLRKTGLEYLDLYLLHQAMGDYFSAWRAMEDAYKEGKLKAIGVSNFYPNILTNFCETVEVKPMVNQVELHPFFAQPEALETMKFYGVVPEAWAPLGGGRYAPFENETLKSIAESHGKSIGQVMLRWNVQRGVVVIPKSTHENRIKENLDIWDFELTAEDMEKISGLDMGYQGTAVKHFDPEFVRMCVTRKIHD